MIDRKVLYESGRWLLWLVVVVGITMGIAVFVALGETVGPDEESPLYVEEFRVAEPFESETGSMIRDQLETITAVTEPYDEVEAAVDDRADEKASSRSGLLHQCITVLKEMAFCTNDDEFLEVIGETPNLRTGSQRERFMEGVQEWYEPGGARASCTGFVEELEASGLDDESMWLQASQASDQMCPEFARNLTEVGAVDALDGLWVEDDADAD